MKTRIHAYFMHCEAIAWGTKAVSSQLVTLVSYEKYPNSVLIISIFKKNRNGERERRIRLNEIVQSRK